MLVNVKAGSKGRDHPKNENAVIIYSASQVKLHSQQNISETPLSKYENDFIFYNKSLPTTVD